MRFSTRSFTWVAQPTIKKSVGSGNTKKLDSNSLLQPTKLTRSLTLACDNCITFPVYQVRG